MTFSYVSLLFVRVLSRSRACRPKCGLLHNSLMESDKNGETSNVSFVFMPSFYDNSLGFVCLSLHAFSDLSCLEWLKTHLFMISCRKMLLLHNQFS